MRLSRVLTIAAVMAFIVFVIYTVATDGDSSWKSRMIGECTGLGGVLIQDFHTIMCMEQSTGRRIIMQEDLVKP